MSYSSRIMNIPSPKVDRDYKFGHRDARHAAAEIAAEAEGEIIGLQAQLEATQSLLDRAMTLIPDQEDLEYLISLAWDTDLLSNDELALIHRFETLAGRL